MRLLVATALLAASLATLPSWRRAVADPLEARRGAAEAAQAAVMAERDAAAVEWRLADRLAEIESDHRLAAWRLAELGRELRVTGPMAEDRRRLVASGVVGLLAGQRGSTGDPRALARAKLIAASIAEPIVDDERRLAAQRAAAVAFRSSLAALGAARVAVEMALDLAHSRHEALAAAAWDARLTATEAGQRLAARDTARRRDDLLQKRTHEALDLALEMRPQVVTPAVAPIMRESFKVALAPHAPALPPGGARALTLPIQGQITARFGEQRQSARRRGITLVGPADQPVLAPTSGRVVFSGPFLRFGLVLIIEHGHEYHTLVAGLSELWVAEDDDVGAGEPIGRALPDSDGAASLYLELRRGGEPVHPLPAMAGHEDKVRS